MNHPQPKRVNTCPPPPAIHLRQTYTANATDVHSFHWLGRGEALKISTVVESRLLHNDQGFSEPLGRGGSTANSPTWPEEIMDPPEDGSTCRAGQLNIFIVTGTKPHKYFGSQNLPKMFIFGFFGIFFLEQIHQESTPKVISPPRPSAPREKLFLVGGFICGFFPVPSKLAS